VELLAAATGVLLAQLQDPLHNVWRRLRLANIPGPAATGLEASRTVLPVAPNPATNGIWAASKVTSRKTCVAVVLFVPVHH
jgi:hypothetical protein